MPCFVIANSLGFEYLMNIAEDELLCSIDCYSYFDTKFEENKTKWKSVFVSKAIDVLIDDLKNITNDNLINKVSFHGDLYQEVDYMFHFVFKVSGEKNI
jgi:hypothetical protein